MSNIIDAKTLRIFVATWNVGGKPPHDELKLEDLLHVNDLVDLYVLGFQEIVPLSAGNVLVIEDSMPAAKWLFLINKVLNDHSRDGLTNNQGTPYDYKSNYCSHAMIPMNKRIEGGNTHNSLFFQTPSLKTFSKNFTMEKGRRLRRCNCSDMEKRDKDSCFRCRWAYARKEKSSGEENSKRSIVSDVDCCSSGHLKYSLIVSKQMVGIFLTIWARMELVQHISHLRFTCTGRGIMGYLGNKGCISVSMSLYKTSFCFVCSHLASGEKEGDELRRNSDVLDILKNTQFPKIYKAHGCWIPEKILEHDRVIWFGDLNYRIALSYSETRKHLKDNMWDALLEKDQLKMEREAGRIFKGWKEGKINFAPTYKYSNDSDTYAGETTASKDKRRTPAWCDRILWYGDGITQFSYFRGESRFSDHRAVCAVFGVQVSLK